VRSLEQFSWERNFPPHIEPKDSLSASVDPNTGIYRDPVKLYPHSHTICLL